MRENMFQRKHSYLFDRVPSATTLRKRVARTLSEVIMLLYRTIPNPNPKPPKPEEPVPQSPGAAPGLPCKRRAGSGTPTLAAQSVRGGARTFGGRLPVPAPAFA